MLINKNWRFFKVNIGGFSLFGEWSFVALAATMVSGCIAYFNLPVLHNMSLMIFVVGCVTILLLYAANTNYVVKIALIFLLFAAIGMLCAAVRIHGKPQYYANIFAKNATINATIEQIIYGNRPVMIVKDCIINGKLFRDKIKVNVRSKVASGSFINVKKGDRITFIASVFPAKMPIRPKPFPVNVDLINRISLNAIANGEITITQPSSLFLPSGIIGAIRAKIANTVMQNTPNRRGSGVIVAMLIGNTGYIPPDDVENIRKSGFAHLLAISGLHISVIAGSVFVMVRFLCANFEYISLRYNTKKIAAIIAAVVGFGYLQITNMSVSAVRSFMMFFLFLLAILLDRRVFSLRVWAIALTIISAITPEKIFLPSLQMSFMATLALISIYRTIDRKFATSINASWYARFLSYIATIFMSSFAAGLATLFYEAYHFGQCSVVGLLSNEIAIPITEILLLPLGVLLVALMPFGFEVPLVHITSIIGDIFCDVAAFFSHLSFAYFTTKPVPGMAIFLQSIGLIGIFSFRIIFIVIGGGMVLLGTFLHYNAAMPRFIATQDGDIIFRQNSVYYSAADMSSAFATKVITQWLNVQDITTQDGVCIREDYCIWQDILIVKNVKAAPSGKFNYCINFGKDYLPLQVKCGKTITANWFRKNGSFVLY
jgi:competence protein ComEC